MYPKYRDFKNFAKLFFISFEILSFSNQGGGLPEEQSVVPNNPKKGNTDIKKGEPIGEPTTDAKGREINVTFDVEGQRGNNSTDDRVPKDGDEIVNGAVAGLKK